MGSFHARALADLPGVDLAVIADPFEANATNLASELGSTATTDPEAVAGDESLDAVVIASPDETHADLAVASMNSGLRVLCEKPLATTVADAQRVVDAEVAIGRRLLQIGFMREYDTAHRQVLEQMQQMGPVHVVRSVHRNTNAESRPDLAVIGQSAIHDLHTLRWLSGQEIVSVQAHATRRSDGGLRHVLLTATMSEHGHGVVEFDDNGFAYEVLVDVTTESGSVVTAPPLRPIVRTDARVQTTIGRDWFGWFADAYRVQDRIWVDSIRGEAAVGPSAWDGLAAQIAVEASLASIASGVTESVSLPTRPSLWG